MQEFTEATKPELETAVLSARQAVQALSAAGLPRSELQRLTAELDAVEREISDVTGDLYDRRDAVMAARRVMEEFASTIDSVQRHSSDQKRLLNEKTDQRLTCDQSDRKIQQINVGGS